MPTTQPSRDSVPYCRVGTTRSGRSNVPVMISIRGPPIRRRLNGVPQAEQKSRSAMADADLGGVLRYRKADGAALAAAGQDRLVVVFRHACSIRRQASRSIAN